jgi:hypothetical protein
LRDASTWSTQPCFRVGRHELSAPSRAPCACNEETTTEKKKRKKTSSDSGDKISEQQKMLAKPLKPSKKFSVQKGGAQSSGLNIGEKTSSTKASQRSLASTKVGGLKAPSASAVGDDLGYALAHAIDL